MDAAFGLILSKGTKGHGLFMTFYIDVNKETLVIVASA